MKCGRCGSDQYRKDGFNGHTHSPPRTGTNRKQRYRCRNCGYNYTLPVVSTVDFKNWGYPPGVREAVLALHRNDRSLGYRRIAIQVGGGLTHGTVRNWIMDDQIKRGERPAKPKKKPAASTGDDAS